MPFGSDDGRGQEEIELAVAVGVEGGDGAPKRGSNPADDGEGAGEVRRPDPPLARGKLSLSGAGPARNWSGAMAASDDGSGRGKG